MAEYSAPIPFKYQWKISETQLKDLMEKHFILSDVKEIPEISGLQYQLQLDIDEPGEKNKTVGRYLTFLNMDANAKICVKYVFFIKSAHYVGYCDSIYECDTDWLGIDNIWYYNDLLDEKKKFLVDGELIIEVKGMLFYRIEKESEKKNSEKCLSELLWKSDVEDRDFVIVAGKENEAKTEIKVHKCVLAVHSPAFKRMFQTDMKEKFENKVNIIDFDAETVKAAIEFCYDQIIFKKRDMCDKWRQIILLHQFADKYDIANLKDEIEFLSVEWFLSDDICQITNAVQVLNSPKLQDLCFQYLLTSLREGIPIKDMNVLDKEYANDLLQKASSIEYC